MTKRKRKDSKEDIGDPSLGGEDAAVDALQRTAQIVAPA